MSKDPKSSFTEPTNENYDAAVSWCRRTIAKGDDMMFSTRAFHEGIDKASRRYGMSFEVRSVLVGIGVCDDNAVRMAQRSLPYSHLILKISDVLHIHMLFSRNAHKH